MTNFRHMLIVERCYYAKHKECAIFSPHGLRWPGTEMYNWSEKQKEFQKAMEERAERA